MSSEITDPEILAFIDKVNGFYPQDAVDHPVSEQRMWYDRMAAHFRQPRPATVAAENSALQTTQGLIPIRRYWSADPGPARVIYYHGGGFVVGGLDSHDDVCAEIADRAAAEVVSVDYRLCPEHTHPAAYFDALAAVDLLADRPIVVVGDSAGGNLAAAVALARPDKICGQVLIYPGLGGEGLNLGSYTERADAPMLTTQDVRYYSAIRGGGTVPQDDPTFAPLHARDYRNLPPCFVSAAEHDPLRDDGVEYIERLTAAGVGAELAVEPELVHGHLRARSTSRRAAAAFGRICKAIHRFTHRV